MMLRTFNLTLGVLVAFSVWCAALLFTLAALHLLAIGVMTAWHLLHS